MRLLLVADTHLGFDLPEHPRVDRTRRGPDFFANFREALLLARQGGFAAVVHGGDLLFRSKVGPKLVHDALAPLVETALLGIPVFLVPGNHERSAIPWPILAAHRGLHVFDRPRTFLVETPEGPLALGGFPFDPAARAGFPALLEATGLLSTPAAVRLLCLHQAFEGAKVGTGFRFRDGADVVRASDIPEGIAAVLSGHIHRAQVLESALDGTPLRAPVIYPGSVERTSAAERREPKGFATLELEPHAIGGRLVRRAFHPLPARPMVDLQGDAPLSALKSQLASLPPNALVRIDLGPGSPTPAQVRSLAPPGMVVETSFAPGVRFRGRGN